MREQVINEQLNDSLYKVISCNIGKLQILNPLNILTKKTTFEISNIDLILMPIFSQEADENERLPSDDSSNDEEDCKQEPSKDKPKMEKQSEEFNILNNLVNKILSNLEVKLQNVSIRVLTNELSENTQDIPTFLLRFNQIEYKREQEVSFQQNPNSPPRSDLQIILEGKTLEFSEISLFYMKHFNMHPDQLHKKNPHISKLKFPFEYPLLNDPTSILVIKPIVNHKRPTNNALPPNEVIVTSPPAIQIQFSFAKGGNDRDLSNQLQLNVRVPNIEVMADFNQLKGILVFAQSCDEYVTNQKIYRQSNSIPMPGRPNQFENVEPRKKKCDDDMIDLYGTIIKTNSTFKEYEKLQSEQPKMKKGGSEVVKISKSKKLVKKTQFFDKKRLLTSFLSKEMKKQQAQGAITFNAQQELHGKTINNTNAFEDQDELYNSLMFSSDVNRSFMSSSLTDNNLSLSLNLSIHKVSLLLLCTEQSYQYQNSSISAPDQQYDRIYDCIYHSVNDNPDKGAYTIGSTSQGRVREEQGVDCKKYPVKRSEHRVGSSYYDTEIRNLQIFFSFKKKEVKAKAGNPFASDMKPQKLTNMSLQLQVGILQLDRYDFLDSSQCHQKSFGDMGSNCVLMENYVNQNPNEISSMNQYESFSQSSGVFQSAVEYYQLEQMEESKFMHVSKRQQSTQAYNINPNMGSLGSTGGGIDQSQMGLINEIIYHPGAFQNYVVTHLFKQNNHIHHFCRNSIFEIIQLTKVQDPQVVTVKIIMEKEKKNLKIRGKGRIGNLRLNVGWNQIIVLMQISKMVENKPKIILEQQKASKKQTTIQSLEFEIEGLGIKIQNVIQQPNQLIGLMIEDEQINQLLIPECVCQNGGKFINQSKKGHKGEFFTLIEVTAPTISIQGKDVSIQIKSIDINMNPKETLLQIPLLCFTNVSVTINNYDNINNNQRQGCEPKEKYRVQRSKIIFEDKEINDDKYSSNSSQSDHEIIQEDDEDNCKSDQKSQQKPLSPKVQIKLVLQQATAYWDMKNICSYMEYLINLEKQIKIILTLQDIIKCQQIQKQSVNQKQKHRNELEPDKSLNHPIHFQVTIDDIQITIVDSDNNVSNSNANKSQQQPIFKASKPIQLLKLRLKNIYFWLSFQVELETKYNEYGVKVILKESQQLIKFDLKLEDGFLLDYTQPLTNYHPSYLKQTIFVQQDPHNFIALNSIPFDEELKLSAPFVILYRQQGLGEKYIEPRLLTISSQINIQQATEFKSVVTLNKIAQYLMDAPENNRVLQVFQDLDRLKKNPMKMEMNITIQGLILRLTFEREMFNKYKTYRSKIKPVIKVHRIAPVVNKEFQYIMGGMIMRDMVSMYFNFQDITIDYTPILQAKLYPQMFQNEDKERKGQDLSSEQMMFKTPLRCIVQLNDSQLIMKENYQSQIREEGSTKLNYVKEKFFIAKVFSISILNNSQSEYKEFLNPTLLLDYQYCLDSLNGQSMIDQLGFSQIFAVDHLELQNQQDCIYEQIFMPNQDKGENISIDHNYVKGGEKNDLFQTTYGSDTLIQNQDNENDMLKNVLIKCQIKDTVEEEKLTIVVNKILLFLAKDSLDAVKNVNKIIQLSINKNKRPKKSNSSKEKDKKKEEEIQEQQDQYEQSELQRVIEDFLFMELEKSQSDQAQSEMKQSLMMFTSDDEEECKWDYIDSANTKNQATVIDINQDNQDYLSGINEGGVHVSKLEAFDLMKVLIENHIPQFNEEDINEGRHRNCHLLKEEIDQKLKKKFYIEINTIDIKLYEGMDFDYDQSQSDKEYNQSQISQSRSLANSMINQKGKASQIGKSRKNQNLFDIDEDYLNIEEDTKSIVELKYSSLCGKPNELNRVQIKRKRKSEKSKSNYFQLLIKNPIFSRHQLSFDDQHNNQIEERTKICFSVKELVLKETISRQGIQRFLLHLPDQYKYDNQICVTIINDEFSLLIETEAKVQIQTFKFTLNQALFTFFQKFFDLNFGSHKKPKNPSDINQMSQTKSAASNVDSSLQESQKKEAKPTFIRSLKIYPFRAILSYTSKSLNIMDLTGGNMIEFLNIFNINDLKIQVKKYEIKQKLRQEDVLKHLLEFYKQDLVGNQKVSFIKAIGPIRSVANIVGAVYGVVNKPYQSYVQDKSVVVGFSSGLYNLYAVFSTETVALSQKVIQGIAGGQKKKTNKGNRL